MLKQVTVTGLLGAAALAAACSSSSSGASKAVCSTDVPAQNDLAIGLGDGGFIDGGCDDGGCSGVLNNVGIADFTGAAATYSPNAPTNGAIPTTSSDFSQNYGTNGRTCFSCHAFDNGWTLSSDSVKQAFLTNAQAPDNDALDPVFRPNDGAVSPTADLSTPAARQAAYAVLLNRAAIRVGIGVPAGAEFTLTAVDDPYNYASAKELSLFRRPLPSQNLAFESDIMWDGREDIACGTISDALANQANDATLTHAAAANPLPPDVRTAIVDFEKSLFAAQATDFTAGALDIDGALGGPVNLSQQPYYIGMNDYAGADPKGNAFNPIVFTLYDAWASLPSTAPNYAARASIVRGQTLFNTRQFTVTNVRGLNDDLGQASIQATCTTCHDTPNVGNNSLAHRYDIGISDAANRTPDLPLYTFTDNQTGATIQTSDPGRALISGRFADMNRFKVPALRNLIARFPYFHNGSAATLADAVQYIDTRFSIGFTADETADLIAFLQVL